LLKENYARSALDGIVKIACKTSNSFEKMVYAYTETSIGMFDFISCWDENTEVM
jgi:hypothetical protein